MKNKKIILLTIPLIILTLLVIGVTYAYYELNSTGESSSTMLVGGANITANYTMSNEIYVTGALPSNNVLAYKDFSVKYTNTSNTEYKIYLKAEIDYNSFTDVENDGVLYYDIYSGSSHNTLVQAKKQFPAITYGKEVLYEIPIPANSNSTTYYRINFYFPESDTKFQNKNGGLTLAGGVVIENVPTGDYNPTLVKYISSMDVESNGLEMDDTDDQNLRYVGATPNNYISFNNETWRIIGIFNVYNNETNKTEKLVKIIRNESLGYYSWDTSDSSINYGCGINEWSQADLMKELNNDYLDTSKTSGTTTWYNGRNNTKDGSYDYSKNIKSGYIDKIANVRWNLGGAAYGESAINTYNQERGTTQVSNPSDGITRTNTWNGKIALMYPSDYGYASTDTDCRSNLHFYANSVYSCKNNNWMFNSTNQWTLSPNSGNATRVFGVSSGGFVSNYFAYDTFGVRPALFLKSDVLITGGTGESIEKAYVIE